MWIKTKLQVLSVALLLAACNRDDKLPNEAEAGTDTFGMELNGQIWTPYIPSPVTAIVSKKPSLVYFRSSKELLIEAKRIWDKPGLICLAGAFTGVGQYHCSYRAYGSLSGCEANTHYSDTGWCISPYLLKDSVGSVLIITKFDTMNKIVSGTFELELEDSFHKVLKITRGRFDSHYSIQN